MKRQTKAKIALGFDALVIGEGMIPVVQAMPSACVVRNVSDFGRPARCDDAPMAPTAALNNLSIASTTSTASAPHMPFVTQYNAITDVEYRIDFPAPARILITPST